MTPTGKGIKIIVGAEITDINRSSGIIGMLDVSNNLVPSLSLISTKAAPGGYFCCKAVREQHGRAWSRQR